MRQCRRALRGVACAAVLACVLAARPGAAGAAPGDAACPNQLIQAINAVTALVIQAKRLVEVCNQFGWGSPQCLVQAGPTLSAALWAWWTGSIYYCNCVEQPAARTQYCAIILALPVPAGGGGAPGGAQPPPPGPPARP